MAKQYRNVHRFTIECSRERLSDMQAISLAMRKFYGTKRYNRAMVGRGWRLAGNKPHWWQKLGGLDAWSPQVAGSSPDSEHAAKQHVSDAISEHPPDGASPALGHGDGTSNG